MTPTLPDEADAWVRAWRDRLNDSEEFVDAAGEFEAAILFVVQPDESYDGDPVRMLVDVADGECVTAAAVAVDADRQYDYALRGPYAAWKALLRDELDTAEAVMGGPFDVEGDTLALMSHRKAFLAMVATARDVDVEFAH
ncbi:Putative sterol carrier protein [Halomicrobium zhouii]|uniref:Putative sterol carrier protein n=1 Tax=Halomicrobium zhouii TaxID=767519 RepID=A0A1I6M6T9_9EURY|nr:SCP2 sterol-binding domain-containing protein [Halomicrobium zhouii]SFS11381.1 Putative sterol carrier protein [Halomicrobium zhouii]